MWQKDPLLEVQAKLQWVHTTYGVPWWAFIVLIWNSIQKHCDKRILYSRSRQNYYGVTLLMMRPGERLLY